MKYRRFGRTELQMPVLTCGGMRFQHKWSDEPEESIPADNQANLERTIERAFELGINHFETARGYGTSEVQLGRILPRLPREKIIVQTKIGPTATAAEYRDIFEKSMRNLRLDHVDLLSLHGLNTWDLVEMALKPGGCLDAVRQFQREGRVRFVGFSTHGPTGAILRAIESGEFDYVNLHWYFVNDFNWPAVEAAARRDMGLFIISPNDKGGMLYQAPPKLVDLCRPLAPMEFNDLYCLARPEVHTLSIGAARPSDFDAHIGAIERLEQAAELVAPVEARLRAEMDARLGAEWRRSWWHGIPEHTEIPGDINVREIVRLWNLAKALDLVEFGRMRYNLLGNGGHWFPGANAGAFEEKPLIDALSGSPFADRIPAILREAHGMLAGEAKQRLSKE